MGIDGGVSGAIAVLDGNYGVLEVHDVPTFTVSIGGKERRELDGPGFIDICRRYLDGGFGLDKILFERGQGVREQSAPAAYSYGFTNGRMVGIAEALQIPYELVDPALWTAAGWRSSSSRRWPTCSPARATMAAPRRPSLPITHCTGAFDGPGAVSRRRRIAGLEHRPRDRAATGAVP